MKKIIALILVILMLASFAACGGKKVEANTVGTKLFVEFETLVKENENMSAIELADALVTNEMIPFAGGAMGIEPGMQMGFGNAEITGFSEGALFAPMIGTIPFIGYVFILEDGADVDAFKETLKSNADPRWNICTEAEETVVENVDNKVFFVMCPAEFEEE